MAERGYGGCGRYVQRAGEIDRLGEHLARFEGKVLVIEDPFVAQTFGGRIEASLKAAGIEARRELFGGECWQGEVDRLVGIASDRDGYGAVCGIGGGKTIDTAKLVGEALGARIVSVPTIASTDAPCSGLAMRYHEDGSTDRPIFLTYHPDAVIVDTQIVVAAPVRFLIAGIGDALSTWYEARSNADTRSKNYIGGGYMMPLAGMAVARQCHETLMRDARGAVAAAREGVLTPAVENIIEANTLLSGLGFENCACSAAHGIHNGLSAIEETHKLLHGEKVAFGTLCLLVLEDRPQAEIDEAMRFCIDLGLPTTLEDMKLASVDDEAIRAGAAAALNEGEPTHATAGELTPETIFAAIKAVDALARDMKDRIAMQGAA